MSYDDVVPTQGFARKAQKIKVEYPNVAFISVRGTGAISADFNIYVWLTNTTTSTTINDQSTIIINKKNLLLGGTVTQQAYAPNVTTKITTGTLSDCNYYSSLFQNTCPSYANASVVDSVEDMLSDPSQCTS